MAEQTENCIICDKSLNDSATRTLKEGSIKSCIAASIRRNDKKHLEFRKFSSINVHTNCAKSYTWEKNIESALKKIKQSLPSTSSTCISTSTRASSDGDFNFLELCFICAKDAIDDFVKKQTKLPTNNRQVVRVVTQTKTRDTLITKLKDTDDRQCLEVYSRIIKVADLVAVAGRYHLNCYKLLFNKFRQDIELDDTEAHKIAKFIANYITENKEECQFSIKEILQKYDTTEWPNLKYITHYLKKIFGEDIMIHTSKSGPIITFVNVGKKNLTDKWYKNKCLDEAEERKRIVKSAGQIILEDIRKKVYECDTYPAPDNFLSDVNSVIPESLSDLLTEIILKDKRSADKYITKITSISHAIIAAARPRSFSSCLQIGLAAMLNKK